MTNEEIRENWKDYFSGIDEEIHARIADWWLSKIADREKELVEEIEKFKVKCEPEKDDVYCKWCGSNMPIKNKLCPKRKDYNQALEDVLDLIK